MSDFLNRIRSGAGRAAFEADRVRRIQTNQIKIRSLYQEVDKRYAEVGQVAYNLYREDQIDQPNLKAACDQLAAVLAQIASLQRDIEKIQTEMYVESGVDVQYGHICPNGHGVLPPQDSYCLECGARAIDVLPPREKVCPHCQATLAGEARFCANCGKEVPAESSSAIGATCANCGASLTSDAAFCTACGSDVTPGSQVTNAADPSGIRDNHEMESVAAKSGQAVGPKELTLCPVCQTVLSEELTFCPECGHQIG